MAKAVSEEEIKAGGVLAAASLTPQRGEQCHQIAIDAVLAANAGPPPSAPIDGTVYVDFER